VNRAAQRVSALWASILAPRPFGLRSACQLHLTRVLEGFDLEVSVWPPAESAFTTELLFDEFNRRVQLVLYLFEDCV